MGYSKTLVFLILFFVCAVANALWRRCDFVEAEGLHRFYHFTLLALEHQFTLHRFKFVLHFFQVLGRFPDILDGSFCVVAIVDVQHGQ